MTFVEPVKIAVVGAGKVGSSFAYAALLRGLASELVLIDKDTVRAQGEAMDLQHAIPFSHAMEIRASNILDTAGASHQRDLRRQETGGGTITLRPAGAQCQRHQRSYPPDCRGKSRRNYSGCNQPC